MAQDINISKDLYDLLVSKNFDPQVTNAQGQETTPDEGTVFKFDYISSSGKNYGTAVALIGDEKELMLFFGDNLGKSMDDAGDKDEWFSFLQQMSKFSTRHNFHTFTPKNLNAIKHTMAGMAAIKEGLFEGYYGNRRVSYMGEATDARLVIKHNRLIGEDDKRYRYVESLFIETADGERFKLPFTKLVGGRAMLEHVRQGGKPYDVRGTHIAETVQEMSVLARFNRASQGRIFEGQTQQLVEAAREYYHNLQNNLKHMGTARGYSSYFESWSPADIGQQEALVEDLKTMFIEQTLDTRIEAALPTLAKIQGTTMKEANEFEAWANKLVEGTWALPETPEAKDKLYSLLNSELPVGPDAANATEQLYDILGDDELFDRLGELADRDANADARPIIIARMKEMGMEVPGVKPEPEVNEGDNLATFEAGCDMDESMGATVAGAVAPVEEGMRADYTRQVIDQILDGELDAYDVMNRPQGPAQEYVAMILQDAYEDVAINHGLHPDDDFEQILDIVVDNLEKDYGHSDDQGVAEGANEQYIYLSPMRGLAEPKFVAKVKGRVTNDILNKLAAKYKVSIEDFEWGDAKWAQQHQDVAEAKKAASHSELAKSAHEAYIAAVRSGNSLMANHYKQAYEKHKRLAASERKSAAQGMAEDSTDPMDHRGAVTDSFYEDLDRLKKLAFVKRT